MWYCQLLFTFVLNFLHLLLNFWWLAHCASLADQCRTRQHSIRSTHLPLHDLFCGLLQSVPKILNTAFRPSWASNFGLVESKHANSCNVNTASHFDLTIFCLHGRRICTQWMIQRSMSLTEEFSRIDYDGFERISDKFILAYEMVN